MSQANTVLIYSTLSENCRKLFDLISPIQNEFINLTGLRLLCIDSKKIRDTVTKSKTVIVDKVPTILAIRQDGGVEMYDGANAFKWTTDIISTYVRPVTPKQPEIIPEEPPMPQPVVQQENIKPKREKVENDTPKPKRPPAGVRTDAGNYDFSADFEEPDEDERKAPMHNIKETKSAKEKSGGIMALAQALQKDRESSDMPTSRSN